MSKLNLTGIPEYAQYKFKYKNKEFVFDHILATLSLKKNIVLTEIQGRDGTVKEVTGQEDYRIEFNGSLSGTNGHYPVEQVQALQFFLNACDINQPIDVIAPWLNMLGVYSIVIESYTLPQEGGGYSYQNFTISAISEKPLELKIF